jgi:rhodanese-related sulfurtransferase
LIGGQEMVFIYLLFLPVGLFVYKRYFPVYSVPKITELTNNKELVLLDLRDYHSTFNEPIEGSLNIPFSYLRRYHKEIPKSNLIIIASDFIEKNLAIRFLLRRKFSISGFIILDDKVKEGLRQWIIINKQKTG